VTDNSLDHFVACRGQHLAHRSAGEKDKIQFTLCHPPLASPAGTSGRTAHPVRPARFARALAGHRPYRDNR
jgi:hypothetical protein